MITVDTIIATLKDSVAAAALREHIVIKDENIKTLADRNVYLEKENADLKRENQHLKDEVAKQRVLQQDFTECRGAYFKRLPDGSGYSESVYCPECRVPLSAFGGDFPYRCDRCNINLDFTLKDVPDILKSLTCHEPGS